MHQLRQPGRHGEVRKRDVHDRACGHAGASVEVRGLSGWRCGACGEVEFDARSARRYAAAGDKLVLRAQAPAGGAAAHPAQARALSQANAARLTGGGHNAFSRYERGEAAPMPAVINLFRLLDRHPELLRELQRHGTTRARAASPRAARKEPAAKTQSA